LKKKDLSFLTVALLLAAILGGLVGDIIGSFLPPGAVQTLFTKSFSIGFEPTIIKLYAITLTIGAMFKINFVSLLSVFLVIIYFKWWYL